MWKLFLLSAIGAGIGYFAGCMKQKKRETRQCFPNKKEESSSNAMVEDWLCHYDSSENKTPMAQLKISDVDNYGVSPYELDRRLRDLLEKQQEEKISELDMQLKSMEAKLCAKEKELQQWKDRVRCLAQHSFGVTSGEDSPTFERASNALSNSSSNSLVSSIQEGNSQLPLCCCVEGPLESTADSKEQLDYNEKMACNYAGLNNLAYAKDMEPTHSRDSLDASCIDFLNNLPDVESSSIDFLNNLADVESSRCQYKSDGNLNTNHRSEICQNV